MKQKSKYRPVDDFSRSAVNQAAGVSEAPALHTVDVIGAMLVDWLKCNRLNGTQCNLLLRTFDLKSAYRQIALSPAGRDVSYIVVFNSLEKRPEYFQCMALPFYCSLRSSQKCAFLFKARKSHLVYRRRWV